MRTPRWEYRVETFHETDVQYEIEGSFNLAGHRGWELVSMVARPGSMSLAVFKRPTGEYEPLMK